MLMAPRLRKLVLTAHLVTSIGWIGALAGFLALAVAGLNAADPQTARTAYVAGEMITGYVIVPLALASLLSGIVQALGTPWGLVRNWWVLFKLLIVAAATFMLLVKTGPIAAMAAAAAEMALAPADLRGLRVSIALHAVGGLAVLLWAAALGMYKPGGLTRFGRRRLRHADG